MVGDEERREFFRVMVRLAISCLTVDGDGGAHLLAVRSVDLSAGGVKIVTEHPLDPGQEVRLSFQVGDPPERMRLDSNVSRIEQLADGFHMCALEFPHLDLSREKRLVQAVFAQEHQNAERHAQVRMSVWERLQCVLDGGEPFAAHATALSSDDVLVVTRRQLRAGDHVRVAMTDATLGFDLDADTLVVATGGDGRGAVTATLQFDSLDRVTRANILRHVMEAERRAAAHE